MSDSVLLLLDLGCSQLQVLRFINITYCNPWHLSLGNLVMKSTKRRRSCIAWLAALGGRSTRVSFLMSVPNPVPKQHAKYTQGAKIDDHCYSLFIYSAGWQLASSEALTRHPEHGVAYQRAARWRQRTVDAQPAAALLYSRASPSQNLSAKKTQYVYPEGPLGDTCCNAALLEQNK